MSSLGALLDWVQGPFSHTSSFRQLAAYICLWNLHLSTTVWLCMTLLAHMASRIYIVQHVRLRLRTLQGWLKLVCLPNHQSLNSLYKVPPAVLESLEWWADQNNICEGVPFAYPPLTRIVLTDASTIGWGNTSRNFKSSECLDRTGSIVTYLCSGASGDL